MHPLRAVPGMSHTLALGLSPDGKALSTECAALVEEDSPDEPASGVLRLYTPYLLRLLLAPWHPCGPWHGTASVPEGTMEPQA